VLKSPPIANPQTVSGHIMTKVFSILTLLFLLTLDLSADPGTSHVLKAKIKCNDKVYIGYFNVWGYLYLHEDSLKSWTKDTGKFTNHVKNWIYGDTLRLFSEIIELKDYNLILYPIDKLTKLDKNSIQDIYPIELIHTVAGQSSYSRVTSSDSIWILTDVIYKDTFYIEGGAACDFTVLYFQIPENSTRDLIKSFEKELREESRHGENRYEKWITILDELKDLRVIVFRYCST
jgi:hypothetical protein